MPGPYKYEDPVQMVRHHDVGVELDLGEAKRQLFPASLDNPAAVVGDELVVANIAKEAETVVGARGDEVGAGGSVS
jgi:hypothetical protein